MSDIKSFEEYQRLIEQCNEIEVLREEGHGWEEIASALGLTGEIAARRLYKKLAKLRDEPPTGIEHLDFTRESLNQVLTAKSTNKRRYLISTITPLAPTNQKAFLSLLYASRELGAELVLLLGKSHVRPLQTQIYHYDPWLKQFEKYITFATEFVFNDRILAKELQITPQQLNPLTGQKSIDWGTENSSVIIASTQICWETAARGNGRSPRILVGTGSISKPKYLMDTRVGVMANQNHDIGAIILEVVDHKKFFLRHLPIDEKSGAFFDIAKSVCKKYTPTGSKKASAEAWVLGDKHIGHDNPEVWKAQQRLAKIVNPKYYVMHDVVDGASGTHWNWENPFRRATAKFLKIADELEAVSGFLGMMRKLLPKARGIVVESNHHNHILEYLEKGKYMRDPHNHEIGHRMVVEMYDKLNPIQRRCDPDHLFDWTKHRDDFYIADVNVAIHGHLGPNGVRGSIKNIRTIERNAIIAHSHSPGIYRNIMQIGHSSAEDHGYNKGPSSWLTADGLIYEGGLKQLIVYFGDHFCM
jgi:hypothetical protein